MSEARPLPEPKYVQSSPVRWVPGWRSYLFVLTVYILVGMEVHFFLSWTRGFIVPLVGIWAIPYLYLRWRHRNDQSGFTFERGGAAASWQDAADDGNDA